MARKEGGIIIGEERLQEHLGALYGDVNSYGGAPTASQMARADVLDRQLADVIKEFQDLSKDRLAVINPELEKKRLSLMAVLSESEWRKTTSASKSVSAANFERDRAESFVFNPTSRRFS